MEDILAKINQHYHNRGVDSKSRYMELKGILQHYTIHESYEGCGADPEIIELLSGADLRSGDAIQAFFMKFGETFLQRSLDQFYTPCTISEFLGSLFLPCDSVLEPASGSGDLIMNIPAAAYHCYDRSEDAIELARLNFLLHGVPPTRCLFDARDTLLQPATPNFPIVITNPPFGVKTVEKRTSVLQQYQYGRDRKSQQLGVLFLEQSLRFLLDDGVLAIILPTGYLTNKTEEHVRRDLLVNHKLLGVFFLPDGTFKRSGTGVDTCLLIIQKTTVPPEDDYDIFVESIGAIGIQTNKKDTPPLYKKNPNTGELERDAAGKSVLENTLPDVARRFLSFMKGVTQQRFREPDGIDAEYVTAKRNDLLRNNASMNMKMYLRDFVNVQRKVLACPHFRLKDVVAKVKAGKQKVVKETEYIYLDISEIQKGTYTTTNRMRGWELPNRATYSVEPNDILLSKLKGKPSFCMISENGNDAKKIIATNGVFRLRIPDEQRRLMVFRYLFTDEFTHQFNTYTGGSIMANIKETDLLNHIVIPELSLQGLAAARNFVEHLQAAHRAFRALN